MSAGCTALPIEHYTFIQLCRLFSAGINYTSTIAIL